MQSIGKENSQRRREDIRVRTLVVPVWVLRCLLRRDGRSKDLPQKEHGSIVPDLFF